MKLSTVFFHFFKWPHRPAQTATNSPRLNPFDLREQNNKEVTIGLLIDWFLFKLLISTNVHLLISTSSLGQKIKPAALTCAGDRSWPLSIQMLQYEPCKQLSFWLSQAKRHTSPAASKTSRHSLYQAPTEGNKLPSPLPPHSSPSTLPVWKSVLQCSSIVLRLRPEAQPFINTHRATKGHTVARRPNKYGWGFELQGPCAQNGWLVYIG